MPTRRTLLVTVVLASTAALAGTLAGRWASHEPQATTRPESILGLVIDSSDLNFGKVVADRNFSLRLLIRNVTDQPIHITEFRTGCDCKPVEPKSLTIPAGERREIRLTLVGEKLPARTVGQPYRVEIGIRPVIGGQQAVAAWKVEGTLLPPIATDVPAVLFGESNRFGQSPVVRNVRVMSKTSGTLRATVSPGIADVQVHPGSGVGEWKVAVSPRTDRTPGAFRGTLTLTNLSPDDNRPLTTLDLPIEGVLLEAEQ